jgi:hypothetical protein
VFGIDTDPDRLDPNRSALDADPILIRIWKKANLSTNYLNTGAYAWQ